MLNRTERHRSAFTLALNETEINVEPNRYIQTIHAQESTSLTLNIYSQKFLKVYFQYTTFKSVWKTIQPKIIEIQQCMLELQPKWQTDRQTQLSLATELSTALVSQTALIDGGQLIPPLVPCLEPQECLVAISSLSSSLHCPTKKSPNVFSYRLSMQR